MSLGPVMLDLDGLEISPEEKELLCHPLVGGIILFSRNYESVEQLRHLVGEIHLLRTPRLLIAVDHEGGRVQRFRDGFSRLPALGSLGRLYESNRARSRRLCELAGWLMAAELRAVGIDFSFAPVLDVDHGISEVIGDRAFHQNPDVVAELAHAYMKGMQEAGMAATGKHFPGHGGVEADSHVAIPVDERSYNDIYAHDIIPFKKLIQHGLAAIMPAHVIYPNVDRNPAGFSPFWLKEVLRKRLRFEGVVFSDDLDMQGASAIGNSHAERAQLALQAGCDMVLICNNRTAAIEILEQLGEINDPVSHLRLARMHGRHDIGLEALHHSQKWREITRVINEYQENPSLELDLK